MIIGQPSDKPSDKMSAMRSRPDCWALSVVVKTSESFFRFVQLPKYKISFFMKMKYQAGHEGQEIQMEVLAPQYFHYEGNKVWPFLPPITSGLADKKGRSILPLQPSGADSLRLHLACPQNNPSRIPFSVPRERFSENMRHPDPALSSGVKVLWDKNFHRKNMKNSLIAFSRLHPWTRAWTKLHGGETVTPI